MRLHPPVTRLPVRAALRDLVLPDGTAVPAGTKAIVDVFSMQRNPLLWKDADDWWPGRWLETSSSSSSSAAASASSATGCPASPAASPSACPAAASTPSAASVLQDDAAAALAAPEKTAAHAPYKTAAAFMPFGGGARACLGRGFAYAEAQVLLAALLCEFDSAHVEGHTPQEIDNLVLTSDNGLPVRLTPRRAL